MDELLSTLGVIDAKQLVLEHDPCQREGVYAAQQSVEHCASNHTAPEVCWETTKARINAVC